jgi:hypothetical protein
VNPTSRDFNPRFNLAEIQKKQSYSLINNGIHAGEPDGIDATMQLFRDLALGKIKVPQNTIISTIPIISEAP